MIKNFSISVQDWVFDSYLHGLKNRSAFIEEMIIKGSELESGDFSSTKQKIMRLSKENRKQAEDISILRRTVESLKQRLSGKRELTDNELMAKSIINRGLLG